MGRSFPIQIDPEENLSAGSLPFLFRLIASPCSLPILRCWAFLISGNLLRKGTFSKHKQFFKKHWLEREENSSPSFSSSSATEEQQSFVSYWSIGVEDGLLPNCLVRCEGVSVSAAHPSQEELQAFGAFDSSRFRKLVLTFPTVPRMENHRGATACSCGLLVASVNYTVRPNQRWWWFVSH